jgi:hypothetical protein
MAKHNALYSGPYVILELKNNIAKLQSIYSGKTLKSFVNVSKLRKLSDDRDILYNRLKPLKQAHSLNARHDVLDTSTDSTDDIRGTPIGPTHTGSDAAVSTTPQDNGIPAATPMQQTTVDPAQAAVDLHLQSAPQMTSSPEVKIEQTVHESSTSTSGATSQRTRIDQAHASTTSAMNTPPREVLPAQDQQQYTDPCTTQDVLPPADKPTNQSMTMHKADLIPHTAVTADSQPRLHSMQLIKAIRGKKMQHRKAYYKVIFEGDTNPHWIAGDELPSNIVIEYNVESYKKKQKAKARMIRSLNQH